MKKLLLMGAAIAAGLAASKRRQRANRSDSARLWSEAVAQPAAPASSGPTDPTG